MADPFPAEATDRIKECMRSVAVHIQVPEDMQQQPIDVALPQRLLIMIGDPDAEIMERYMECPHWCGHRPPAGGGGVPFPPRWSLKEQSD